nr:hypothetical protein [Bacteroidota bacterium]
MKKQLLPHFIGLFLILLFAACKTTDQKFISEGIIEYDAALVDQDNPMATWAPSKMTIKFKD